MIPAIASACAGALVFEGVVVAGAVRSRVVRGLGAFVLGLLAGCNNSPHPHGSARENTLYMAFAERSPRYLDPTSSYSAPESTYVYEISEPPYGYHHLKRPYQLIPRAAAALAKPYYLDAQGKRLPDDAPDAQIAEAVYDISIKPGVKWSPHPAFAKDAQGQYLYHHLKPGELGDKRSPFEFKQLATREVVAEDFVYALKRHASPRLEAPVAAVFSEHILGLKDYIGVLKAENAKLLAGLPDNLADKPFLDLRRWPLAGAVAVNDHLLRIRLKGRYPQWQYWLATNFTAAIPWEVDAFYAQPGMAANSMSWNQWPVGSGPFMMTEYVQDRRHVMSRNPNYHGDAYPCEGSAGDAEAGRLADCGKPMPFVDKVVAINVKERVPIKELFKQGYLDLPEMDRADWGVNLAVDRDDSDEVRAFFEQRGFRLPMDVDISNWYLGFNWLDPVIGRGDTPEQQRRNRALRQAISIAIDWEEGYGRIFRDKGGDAAHGPIPPGVFGSREGQPGEFNPVTHRLVNGRIARRPIEDAYQLMEQAGYPGGRDARTGKPLVLNYDFQRVVTPELKAENDWLQRQFAKLGIQLDIRATDFNQFQEKILKGKHQIFWWGWFADYPDAENFLFLLYGPNSKSLHEGENTSNYANPEFDRLYRKLQSLEDGPEKAQVMAQMNDIARQDAPWAWGYWSYSGVAFQHWVYNGKSGVVVRDRARYLRVDATERAAKIAEWNRPVWWPLLVLAAGGLAIFIATRRAWRRRETATALQRAA
jgi:ABC-type transport system substrate-binding protein